jgi:hypothetical protein
MPALPVVPPPPDPVVPAEPRAAAPAFPPVPLLLDPAVPPPPPAPPLGPEVPALPAAPEPSPEAHEAASDAASTIHRQATARLNRPVPTIELGARIDINTYCFEAARFVTKRREDRGPANQRDAQLEVEPAFERTMFGLEKRK